MVQVIKPLQVGYNLSMIMSGSEAWNITVLDAGGRLTETGQIARCPANCFRWWVPATGKAWPPTVDILTDGTSRRLVRTERRERRLGNFPHLLLSAVLRRRCCRASAPAARRLQRTRRSPARRVLSNKPAARRCCCRSTGQTDGQR